MEYYTAQMKRNKPQIYTNKMYKSHNITKEGTYRIDTV